MHAKRQREDSVGHEEHHQDHLVRSVKRRKIAQEHDVQPCHFYKLARELRDMVYHHLWKATPLLNETIDEQLDIRANRYRVTSEEVQYPAPSVCVIYDGADEADDCCLLHERLPQWLLVDKTFLGEGLAKLRSNAIWDIDASETESCSARGLFSRECLLNTSLAHNVRLRLGLCGSDDAERMIGEL